MEFGLPAHNLHIIWNAYSLREGVAEELIQVQLGHASLESTDKYLRKIGANEAVAVVRVRGWG